MKLLTFAIPCYNSQDYMEKCIESILPGGEDVEIIIVDDGSIDNSKEICTKLMNDDKRKDVTTLVLKKKTKNKDDVRIISNLPQIIKFILELEHDPIEFIDLASPVDLFYADEIKKMLEAFTLSGNFTRPYLSTVVDQYNEVIDEILMEVRIKLCENIF